MYPAVGNGFLATQVGSSALFVSGFYSGKATTAPSKRAALSSPLPWPLLPSPPLPSPPLSSAFESLRPEIAVFTRRGSIPQLDSGEAGYQPCSRGEAEVYGACARVAGGLWWEQRWYAHRLLRSLVVHEVVIIGSTPDIDTQVTGPFVYVKPEDAAARDLDVVAMIKMRRSEAGWAEVEHEDVTAALDSNAEYADLHGRFIATYFRAKEAEVDVLQPTEGIMLTSRWPDGDVQAFPHVGDVIPYLTVVKLDLELPSAATTTHAASHLGKISTLSLTDVLLKQPAVNYEGMGVREALLLAAVRDMRAALQLVASNTLLTAHTAAWKGSSSSPVLGFHDWWPDYLNKVVMANAASIVGEALQGTNVDVKAGADGLLSSLIPSPLWGSSISLLPSAGGSTEIPQIAIMSQYSLWSFLRPDWPFGSSPGGLSTNGYNGHQFWDYDTFSAPIMELLQPGIAVSVMDYRLHRLPGARQKAQSYTPPYVGAMMPWESAFTGVETCPEWAATGNGEIHISGDVAVSFWQHWQLSNDRAWLAERAFPVIAEVADFWVSRAVADSVTDSDMYNGRQPDASSLLAAIKMQAGRAEKEEGLASCSVFSYICRVARAANSSDSLRSAVRAIEELHITNVIPPTEFYQGVADSAYTNAVALTSMHIAIAAGEVLDMPEAVLDHWRWARERLHVPFTPSTNPEAPQRVIPTSGIHPYFNGYKWSDQVQLLDPLMLWWPLDLDNDALRQSLHIDDDVFLNNLAHYITHQEPTGSVAFSWAVNAIMFGHAGDEAKLMHYLRRSFETFVVGPFKVWMEGSGGWGCPNFVTGAGGFLEALVFGYARVRIRNAAMELRPILVEGFDSFRLDGIHFLGQPLNIEYNTTHVSIDPHMSPLVKDPLVGIRKRCRTSSDSEGRMWWTDVQPGELSSDARFPAAALERVFNAKPWLRDTQKQTLRSIQCAMMGEAATADLVELEVVEPSGRRRALDRRIDVERPSSQEWLHVEDFNGLSLKATRMPAILIQRKASS